MCRNKLFLTIKLRLISFILRLIQLDQLSYYTYQSVTELVARLHLVLLGQVRTFVPQEFRGPLHFDVANGALPKVRPLGGVATENEVAVAPQLLGELLVESPVPDVEVEEASEKGEALVVAGGLAVFVFCLVRWRIESGDRGGLHSVVCHMLY